MSDPIHILGINAYHGDSSAALISNGRLVASAEEERFNRVKHWAGVPVNAMRYCLESGNIGLADVHHIAISRNPRAHLFRKALFALRRRPSAGLILDRVRNANRIGGIRGTIADGLGVPTNRVRAVLHNVEHHKTHMASAFFVSPFEQAACLSIDGFGDFVSTMWGTGSGHTLTTLGRVGFPHSLGLFYTAVTQYLGFMKYGDEYKVMGLASYGEAEYFDDFRQIVRVTKDGFRLNLEFLLHHSDGVAMSWDGGEPIIGRVYSDAFVKRFGPARAPGDPIEKRHANLAASAQKITEEIYFHVLNRLYESTRQRRLCLAGGVALNSVANGKVKERTPFDELYIQPAAGDAGTAIGAACFVQHGTLKQPRVFVMDHAYWGPAYSEEDIQRTIENSSLALEQARCTTATIVRNDALCARVARSIADGMVVGWFQGRMEWGPRALGNRSILADPRRAEMKDVLNARIKRRESFRPFCPSILLEAVDEYIEGECRDPFMITVHKVRPQKRSIIPAVTHIDGTGRVQVVSKDTNELYWKLLTAFSHITGVPVLLNTSFNENEPVVCTPRDAMECFLRTRMDVLVLGNTIVEKPSQAPAAEPRGTAEQSPVSS